MHENDLEETFIEMTQGFSEIEFSEGPIFIKHPGLKEVAELNRNKKKFLKKAKDMGVMTEKELLEFLEKDGVWTKEEESFSLFYILNLLLLFFENACCL